MSLPPWRDFQLAFIAGTVAFLAVGALTHFVYGLLAIPVGIYIYDRIVDWLEWIDLSEWRPK